MGIRDERAKEVVREIEADGGSLRLNERGKIAGRPAALLRKANRVARIKEVEAEVREILLARANGGATNGHSAPPSPASTPPPQDGDSQPAAEAGIPCKRCGGSGEEPIGPTLAEVIEGAVVSASWAGWPIEVTREKLTKALEHGDRVIGINYYQLIIERPTGEFTTVPREDA